MHIIMACSYTDVVDVHYYILDVKCFGISSWKMSPEPAGVLVDGM